jgi:hypothetical protein
VTKEGRKEGREQGRTDGRNDGRKVREGRNERREEGWKAGRTKRRDVETEGTPLSSIDRLPFKKTGNTLLYLIQSCKKTHT